MEPADGTIEQWAWRYVVATDLATKVAPPPPPREWEGAARDVGAQRIARPGRPHLLVPASRRNKTPSADALRDPSTRARLLHAFWHHELQAAELMCWAILAFPDAPTALRRGLLGVALDEVRHMAMYAEHIEHLGHRIGDFPVNDWFWERVPQSPSVAHFVAAMGMGFEAGNLDHTRRFEERFREAGDPVGAKLQAVVADEEVPHVALGTHWFRALASERLDFDAWREHLPAPLTPIVMRGAPLARGARERAGFTAEFLDRLEAWSGR
jgi:uncharacterized ferritin-like protein (DUF455 family)